MKKVTNGYATKADLKKIESNLRTDIRLLKRDVGSLKSDVGSLKDKILESEVKILGELQKMRDDDDAHKFSHMRINDEIQELQNSVESLKKGNITSH